MSWNILLPFLASFLALVLFTCFKQQQINRAKKKICTNFATRCKVAIAVIASNLRLVAGYKDKEDKDMKGKIRKIKIRKIRKIRIKIRKIKIT